MITASGLNDRYKRTLVFYWHKSETYNSELNLRDPFASKFTQAQREFGHRGFQIGLVKQHHPERCVGQDFYFRI